MNDIAPGHVILANVIKWGGVVFPEHRLPPVVAQQQAEWGSQVVCLRSGSGGSGLQVPHAHTACVEGVGPPPLAAAAKSSVLSSSRRTRALTHLCAVAALIGLCMAVLVCILSNV